VTSQTNNNYDSSSLNLLISLSPPFLYPTHTHHVDQSWSRLTTTFSELLIQASHTSFSSQLKTLCSQDICSRPTVCASDSLTASLVVINSLIAYLLTYLFTWYIPTHHALLPCHYSHSNAEVSLHATGAAHLLSSLCYGRDMQWGVSNVIVGIRVCADDGNWQSPLFTRATLC